jgi:hypothetical protein
MRTLFVLCQRLPPSLIRLAAENPQKRTAAASASRRFNKIRKEVLPFAACHSASLDL